MKVDFNDFERHFFEKSKKWLADSETKRLTLTPDINDDDREKWFLSLPDREDYFIKGISCDGQLIGAVGIKHIDMIELKGEYWGYIGEKSMRGKGIGRQMLLFIEDVAMCKGLNSLYLHVAPFNEMAINLYLKCGYEVLGEEEGLIRMEKALSNK